MAEELGAGNKKPEVLEKLAQYEITLLDWVEAHKGYKKYVTIAGKCWPAFQTQFGFVPCYVNSRLTKMGIPVACEVDIYGALSEFIGTVVSNDTVTLLDINNTVPADIYGEDINGKFNYTSNEVFMGFHCGNTASTKLTFCEMRNQMIMARSLPVEVTNGTLEGDIVPGDITFFRLQSTSDAQIRAYIAQGEVLPVATRSFGAIGILQFLRWTDSIAMYLLRRITRITELLLSDISEKHSMKYLNILGFRLMRLISTSQRV